MVYTNYFNKTFSKLQLITTRHVLSLQVKAAFEVLVYNRKDAIDYNKQAYDIVKMRIKIRRYNRWGNQFMEEMLSYDSCYVTVSLEKSQDFCKMIKCNDSFLTSFGYDNR